MSENNNNNNNNNGNINAANNGSYNFVNSRALFVLKIITMSFAILACVVAVTVMLTKWILGLNRKIRESNTKIAKAAARLNKFRRMRIRHILKQRKLQLKEEKKDKRKKHSDRDKNLLNMDNCCINENSDADMSAIDEITDEEAALNDFDNELSDILLDNIDDEI